jgi:hypothetical protein
MSKAMTIDEMIATNPIAFNIYINKIKKEATKLATAEALKLVSYTITLELHDKFGFGAVRLNRLFDRTSNQMECIVAGTVDLNEIVQEVKRLGVVIE